MRTDINTASRLDKSNILVNVLPPYTCFNTLTISAQYGELGARGIKRISKLKALIRTQDAVQAEDESTPQPDAAKEKTPSATDDGPTETVDPIAPGAEAIPAIRQQ